MGVPRVVLDCLRCGVASWTCPCSGLISDGGGLMSWSLIRMARSRRRVGVLACVLVLVAAAGVGGCSDSGEGMVASSSKPRSSASAASSASAVPSAGASGQASARASASLPAWAPPLSSEEQAAYDAAMAMPEPGRREGMDERSPSGAAASAAYFLTLYPYVYATGDLTDWEEMSAEGCGFCSSVAESVNDLHSDGGWVDPWQPEIILLSYGTDPSDPDRHVIEMKFSQPERTIHQGSTGNSSREHAVEATVRAQMHWEGDRWIVEKGEVQ